MKLLEQAPLASRTTIGLGGAAKYVAECFTEDDLREALIFARERRLPVCVLGGGSNLIFQDAGFAGVVIQVALAGVTFDDAGTFVTVRAGAGVNWDDVVAQATERGLSGIECLSGIPGTVGGTPIQNVGAYGQEVAETIVTVSCLRRDSLERQTFEAASCGFAYRTSRFKRADRDRYVVSGVTLQLRTTAPAMPAYPELAAAVRKRGDIRTLPPADAIRLVRETVLALRRGKSMVLSADDPNARSVGSFFLNPIISPETLAEVERRWRAAGGSGSIPVFPAAGGIKVAAAWLVEQAGFRKGYRRNGVGISTRHALALVNLGGNTRQLLGLATEIEQAVAGKFGIRLEREPVVVE